MGFRNTLRLAISSPPFLACVAIHVLTNMQEAPLSDVAHFCKGCNDAENRNPDPRLTTS